MAKIAHQQLHWQWLLSTTCEVDQMGGHPIRKPGDGWGLMGVVPMIHGSQSRGGGGFGGTYYNVFAEETSIPLTVDAM